MVMRQMREHTKWIMLIVAVSFVGLMVFEWGMDLSGRSGTQLSGGEIGRVNGQAVPYEEWVTAYRSLYEQQAAGGRQISSALNDQIEDAAWDQLVMQRLVSQELRRRGIRVTDAEIRMAARFAPPPEFQAEPLFQNEEGQFDIARYHAFLSSPAVDTDLLLKLESYYRDAIPRSKLYYQATTGTYVTDNQLWRMWQDANEKVRVSYVAFDPAALVPETGITVSDAEIRKYYTEHKSDFLRPAQATVRYLLLDRSPTAVDSAAALQRAEEARAQVASGASLEEVARRELGDSVPAAGSSMTVMRGQSHPAIEQAAFSLRPGSLSEPILTPAGYSIVRVESRSGDSASVRQIQIPVRLSEEAEDRLFDQADSLEVLADKMPLAQMGEQFGLQIRDAELFPGLSFIPGLGLAEEGVSWAFGDGQVGEVSPVFETPSAYYAFELVQRQDERTLSVEEANPTIRMALIALKRLERAKENVRQALDRIRAGESSLEKVAAEYDTQLQEAGPFSRGEFVPGLGRLNPAIGTAFGLKSGELSGVVESDRKLYLIRLLERQDASRADWEQQKDEQRARVTQAFAEQRWNQFITALREQADIYDGREELSRRSAQQARTM